MPTRKPPAETRPTATRKRPTRGKATNRAWPDLTQAEIEKTWLEAPDNYLQAVIQSVTGTEMEFPVTLSVRGLLISGVVVSGHRFFEGFPEQVEDPTVREALAIPAAMYRARKRKDGDEATYPAPRYVHLKDARFFQPGHPGLPTASGTWWRGRVESIDGWFLGTLSEG